MQRKRLALLVLGFVVLLLCSCSGGGGMPVVPGLDPAETKYTQNSHLTWGLWQFTVDPGNQTLDVVQLRAGNLHLNALPFLEPPPYVNLTIESLKFNGDEIYAEIGLRHPFIGLTQYTGFDVCGILITNGSVTGFDDPDLFMAGENDTHLLNPDGFSRWWNPAEFPINNGTIFGYTDGLLGAPDSIADYNSTLNAYKFYCDDLIDPDAGLSTLDPSNRCIFSVGEKNTRMYRIKVGTEGLVFNYAVDACWKFPDGGYPWEVPDDFGPKANRPEAWNVSITEISNTLWSSDEGSGGNLSLLIDVWDHFDADLNTVKVESPGNFIPVESITPLGGGEGYSTYQIDITDATPSPSSIDLLISVICEVENYQGLLPGKPVTVYFTYTADVATEEPVKAIYVDDSNTSGIEDGTKEHPFDTIQEGVDAAAAHGGYEWTVFVDDSGAPYEEQVDMTSGVLVKSDNWDESDGTVRAFIDGPDTAETYSVYFNGVSDTTLEGFRIGFAGFWDVWLGYETRLIGIDGGSGITISDCLFTGQTDIRYIYCFRINAATDVEIANCQMGPMDTLTNSAPSMFWGVYAENCPGLVVRNNIVTDIWSTEGEWSREVDCVHITGSGGVVVKNNLFHHIVPHAGLGSMGAVLLRGFSFENSPNAEVANNTVDRFDSSDAFFINQAFAYSFRDFCTNVTFTNNIATHIYSDGGPSPLARGVQAFNCTVVCDFTDIYDIGPGGYGAPYYQDASPGIGALSVDPLYLDPDNGEYDVPDVSPAQWGDPYFVDWDDTGPPSGDPDNLDLDTRSRMGCHGGPGGEHVGLLT